MILLGRKFRWLQDSTYLSIFALVRRPWCWASDGRLVNLLDLLDQIALRQVAINLERSGLGNVQEFQWYEGINR